ncbi:PHP domain-containing protein [Leptolyngbya sp. FACHB-711]|uniref:PHP domain-containing protein n=1 Tax=unclassified Leptolyngbya TaxID=2650499 RepID=UPI0016863075|nr:PHP domain-containing protein [Leptolyngbya sp. FACHB-711]MBD1851863.1 PHP domain-containing protein [Cyanobacteria bacterium FACHB-502]MBD2027859.1 PHP domain-containing protein [Leptolyngbya sp. FACHB-711]
MAIDLALSSSVSAQDRDALRTVFQSLTVTSCPRSYNFHMHTVHSDGRLQPQQVIAQAIEIGLQGLAITDHHSVGGYQVAQRWLDQRRTTDSEAAMPRLWTGVEINAGLLDVEVHILGYAFDPQHPAIAPYLNRATVGGEGYQAEQVIEALHRAAGLAVLAHPARYRRSPKELIPAAAQAGIDGIETFYAYENPSPWQSSPRQTSEVQALGQACGLLNSCGTDTHGMSLLQRL